MLPSVFITRQLSTDSPFQKIMTTEGYQVHGESLLHFEAIAFDTFPDTDWVFFYSKNAIRFFFEALKKREKKLPSSTKIATIGKGTATILEVYQFLPYFVGTGHPVETAQAFKNIAKGQTVLFPRASTSHQSIQKLLAEDIIIEDLIVYENTPKTAIDLPKIFDCLVFTSSMNAQAYFQKYDLQQHQRVVAIGTSTAQTLKELGVDRVEVALKPTEEAMAMVCCKM